MAFELGTFRRNAMKTVGPKPAQLSVRLISRNRNRINVANTALALQHDTGRLLHAMSRFILGLPLNQEMKDEAAIVLGDLGLDLTVLARILKVKMPSPGRKIKMVGTLGAAFLEFNEAANAVLEQTRQSLFAGPKMTTVKKLVMLPAKGTKEEREVPTINIEQEALAEKQRVEAIKTALATAIELYFRICNGLYQNPPLALWEAKAARLHTEFPGVEFEAFGAKTKGKAEAKTASAPPATASKPKKQSKKLVSQVA